MVVQSLIIGSMTGGLKLDLILVMDINVNKTIVGNVLAIGRYLLDNLIIH